MARTPSPGRRGDRSPEFRSVPLDAGAIVRCASIVGDRGYKRTLTQPLESNFSTGATTRIRLYVIHVYQRSPTKSCGCASPEGLFRLQFAQGRVAQLDLAPTPAAFASRSVISTPPRFARDYCAHARLVICVETPRLRTSDAEHDEGASRKPSLHAIRESRIALFSL